MAVEVLIPKLGLTMETGLVEEWLVAPGTRVEPGDPLLRLATDKVNVDVEAEGTGLFRPAVEPGAELPPGALVGWLLEAGEEPPGTPGRRGRLLASPNARRVARERGIDIARLTGTGPGGRIVTADVPAAPVPPAAVPPAAPAAPARGASPLVRRAAAAAGVDLTTVVATGPGGRVLRSDVIAASGQAASGQAGPGQAGPAAAQVIPLTGMRGVIASRMHASLREMAQLTLGTEAVMDAAVALRAQLREQWRQAGIPVPTITDLIARAAALALREHPRLNALVRAGAVHVQPEINIGIAVALRDGLLVPVLRRADQLTLSALCAESSRLAECARTGRLALSDLEGGTFTVSTLGSSGIDFFTPVVIPDQVAILGVGRVRDSVRWEGETPVRTQVLTLSLTFDHRAVDGAPAAAYLRTVVSRLAHPLSLLS